MDQATITDSFRQIFDAALDPMLVVDSAGTILVFNAPAADLFGYTEAQFAGLSVDALVPQGMRARHRQNVATFVSGPRPRVMGRRQQVFGRRQDGTEFAAEVGLSPLGHGYTLASIHDASNQRLVDIALQESLEDFRSTFDQAAVGLVHIARDGRWLRLNPRFCAMLGHSQPLTITEPSFQTLVHPDDRAGFLLRLGAVATGRAPGMSQELRLMAREGDTVWVNVTVSMVQRGPESPGYFLAVVEDIRGRRQAEETLSRMRAEMTDLVSVQVARHTAMAIAHELNQPLVAVAAYSEAALRMLRAGTPDPDRLARALQGSADQAQRAGQVVRELLQFLHQGDTVTAPVDLNAMVRNALDLVHASGLWGHDVRLELDEDLPPVQANQIQIEKVLVNLVTNSIEAMREHGVPAPSIQVTVRTGAQAGMAHVTVRDTGPGLDAGAARRIFDPFFTTKKEGIGMGLAISRALVEAHGGQLWLDTKAGPPGATFHFTLPFAR